MQLEYSAAQADWATTVLKSVTMIYMIDWGACGVMVLFTQTLRSGRIWHKVDF